MHRFSHRALIAFFVCIAVIGSWHGFPLVDIYRDESYFALAPIMALKNANIFPQHVPYGTVMYLLLLPLQTCVVSILWIIATVAKKTPEQLLLTHLYLGYIAPRVLNAVLYILSAILILWSRKKSPHEQNVYAPHFCLIFLLSTPLLLIFHSGKMWGTSLFFILLSGLSLPTYPLLSVLAGSLAFANFPIMGIFWLSSIACALWIQRGKKKAIIQILLVSLFVPAIIMLLNYSSIKLQIADIFENFIGTNVRNSLGPQHSFDIRLMLHVFIMGGKSLAYKIVITSPFAILALVTLWRAKIINPLRCIYAIACMSFYVVALIPIVQPGYNGNSFRYVAPIIMTLVLCISSFDIPASRTRTVLLSALTLLSVYGGIIFVTNLAIPTTYNYAQKKLGKIAFEDNAVILSSVTEIQFPYTLEAAILTQKWMPDTCGVQCTYTLEHPTESSHGPTYLHVKSDSVRAQIIETLGSRNIILVDEVNDASRVSVESGAGAFNSRSGWWIVGFGQAIHIERLTKIQNQ